MTRIYLFLGFFLSLTHIQFTQGKSTKSSLLSTKDDPLLADEGSGDYYDHNHYDRGNSHPPIDTVGGDDEDYLSEVYEGSADSPNGDTGGIYDKYDDYYDDDYDQNYPDYDNSVPSVVSNDTSTTESYDGEYDPYENFGVETRVKSVDSSSTSTTTTTTVAPLVVPGGDVTSDFNIIEHADPMPEEGHEEVAPPSNPDRTVPKYSPDQDYRWYNHHEDEENDDEHDDHHMEGSGYGPHSVVPGRVDEEDIHEETKEDDFFVPPDFEHKEKKKVSEEEFSIPTYEFSPPDSSVRVPTEDPAHRITSTSLPVEEESHKDMDTSIRILTQKDVERQVSIFAQPGILAAFIGGAVIGLLCAILLVMFIVYRMRKRDEGSYPLDEPKRMPLTSSYSPNDKEIYA